MGLETIYGQPSWHIASNEVEAYLTQTGGHLGPVTFDVDGRRIRPFSIASWHDEKLDETIHPPIIRVLRGDFFCMPFGANETEFEGERHPPHGETANGQWSVVSGLASAKLAEPAETGRWSVVGDRSSGAAETSLVARLELSVRSGLVEKTILLKDDQTVVYQLHRITGLSGCMTFGHHAMLKFPDREGSGLVSTSPFVWASTAPLPVELPEDRGYSLLAPDRRFDRLDDVATITGDSTDLSRYPARKGFEDLVMLVSEPREHFAWSAVAFPEERYVWFALKDPVVLRNTVLWLSNRGRYYEPWNGRHECVMGIEEVTSYFHYGLAESVADNPVSDLGYPTFRAFDPNESFEVRYLMGVSACPDGFGRVVEIEPAGNGQVAIRDGNGHTIEVPVDWRFVRK